MIKKGVEIKALLVNGRKLSGRTINIYDRPADKRRFAVLTPKRIGHAVQRNIMKRLVREIYRKHPSWFEDREVAILVKRFKNSYASLEREIGDMVAKK